MRSRHEMGPVTSFHERAEFHPSLDRVQDRAGFGVGSLLLGQPHEGPLPLFLRPLVHHCMRSHHPHLVVRFYLWHLQLS